MDNLKKIGLFAIFVLFSSSTLGGNCRFMGKHKPSLSFSDPTMTDAIVVANEVLFFCNCGSRRLSSDNSNRKLSAKINTRIIASDISNRRLDSDITKRRLGSDVVKKRAISEKPNYITGIDAYGQPFDQELVKRLFGSINAIPNMKCKPSKVCKGFKVSGELVPNLVIKKNNTIHIENGCIPLTTND